MNGLVRFRNNLQWATTLPLFRRPGLTIERRRFSDQRPLMPQIERWRSWSMQLTLSGTRYVSYGDRSFCQAPTSLVLTSPQIDPMRIRYLPGATTDWLNLTWTNDGWQHFINQHPHFNQRHAYLIKDAVRSPLLAVRYVPPPALHAARQLITIAALPEAPPATLENAATTFLALLSALDFQTTLNGYAPTQAQSVEKAQALMMKNLERPPSISQLASTLHISPRQLQRDFLACTGLSPLSYLQMLRLSEANMLLASTNLPIGTIASRLGYASAAHFSAAFRRLYDCTPRQIREYDDDLMLEAVMEEAHGCSN